MQVRIHVVGGDRRRIDQLHRHVLPGHHGGGGHGRGERIGRHLGRRPGEAGDQLALAGVRAAQQDRRARALPRNAQAAGLLAAALLGRQLLLELGDLRFQVRLKVIGPLVLGDLLHHHLEALQFLFQGRRPTVILFGLEVLLGEIGRHCRNKRVPRFRIRTPECSRIMDIRLVRISKHSGADILFTTVGQTSCLPGKKRPFWQTGMSAPCSHCHSILRRLPIVIGPDARGLAWGVLARRPHVGGLTLLWQRGRAAIVWIGQRRSGQGVELRVGHRGRLQFGFRRRVVSLALIVLNRFVVPKRLGSFSVEMFPVMDDSTPQTVVGRGRKRAVRRRFAARSAARTRCRKSPSRNYPRTNRRRTNCRRTNCNYCRTARLAQGL